MPPSHDRRKRTRDERHNEARRQVGHTRASERAIPTRQNQRSENEELDRLTYQGGPFPIIKLGHSGLTNTGGAPHHKKAALHHIMTFSLDN